MSHGASGYFYYEYLYEFEWDFRPGFQPDPKAQGKDEGKQPPYRTAYYTEHRQDHGAQTDWYKNRVRPTIEEDCKKIIDLYNGQNLERYPKEDQGRKPNRFGRIMKPFNWNAVIERQFKWTKTLPTTTEGDDQGKPYGKKI